MRPKVVLVIFAIAFGILGIIAVTKGLGGKSDNGSQPSSNAAQTVSQTDISTNKAGSQSSMGLNSTNAPQVSEALHETLVDKEVGDIQDMVGRIDGTNNPIIIEALVAKLGSTEPDVRKAALDGLKQIDDTNAVPSLRKAVDNIQDPREKVAVLDVIDYINLPSVTQNVAPELATNPQFGVLPTNLPPMTNVQFNPNFVGGNRNGKK